MLPDRIQLGDSLTVAALSPTAMQFRSGESVIITVTGNVVPTLIPALLSELASPQPWSDVVSNLEKIATPEVIRECAELLFENEILVEASARSGPRREEEKAVYRFFAHQPYMADEMVEKIRSGKLGTLYDNDLDGRLIERLRAHGFTQFVPIDRNLSCGQVQLEELNLLIALVPHMEASTLDTINKACLATGTAWLPIDLYGGEFCTLGPLVVPGAGGCYECYRSRIRSNLQSTADAYDDFINFQRSTRTSVSHYGMLPAGIEIVFGIACLEAIKLVTQWQVPACIGHNLVLNLIDLELQRHRVLQIPRCPACSNSEAASEGHWTI